MPLRPSHSADSFTSPGKSVRNAGVPKVRVITSYSIHYTKLYEFDTDTAVVYYYTEVVGLGGQKVTHRWKLEGKVTKEVVLPLKGSRQGVWSMHKMQPDRTGNWMVEVVNPLV